MLLSNLQVIIRLYFRLPWDYGGTIAKNAFDCLDGSLLHRPQGVGVVFQRNGDILMPEAFTDYLYVYVGGQQQRCDRVP